MRKNQSQIDADADADKTFTTKDTKTLRLHKEQLDSSVRLSVFVSVWLILVCVICVICDNSSGDTACNYAEELTTKSQSHKASQRQP